MLLCFQPVLSPKHNLRGNRSTNPSTATVRQEGADGEHFMKPKYFRREENIAFKFKQVSYSTNKLQQSDVLLHSYGTDICSYFEPALNRPSLIYLLRCSEILWQH